MDRTGGVPAFAPGFKNKTEAADQCRRWYLKRTGVGMARRERLCPEVTDPSLRGFLDMLPSIREYNTQIVMEQKRTVQTEEFALPGRKITICFHRAKDADGNLMEGKRPVLFEFHGGGFMLGNAEKTDALCEKIAMDLGIHVVGVNYRLAPEFPYPAALKDAYGVIRRMYQRAEQYGIDQDQMAVMGYSAGATLATASAMQAVLNGELSLKAQILHYPYLDAVHLPEEKKHYDCDMAPEIMRAFTLLYSTEEERSDPFVSPVLAGEELLAGNAPALVLPAQRDSLKEEGLLYAEHLQKAGVPVKVQVMERMHHGYVEDAANPEAYETTQKEVKETHDPSFWQMADKAIQMSEDFLRERLGV